LFLPIFSIISFLNSSPLMNPVTISPNCDQVYFNLVIPNLDGEVTINLSNGADAAQSFIASAQNGFVAINVNFLSKGVVTYQIVKTDTVVKTGYVIASCEIDCCIAKLTEEAIMCYCKCDSCNEQLKRAYKVSLLLQAAKFAAETESNFDDAISKYNKAKELCTEVCACGC
jgi:hypothetical protein